jgi:hypothetical protein
LTTAQTEAYTWQQHHSMLSMQLHVSHGIASGRTPGAWDDGGVLTADN